MLTWFRRFAVLGGIVIVLELVAWIGIATLGPDAFRQMLAFYDPRPEPAAVVEERGEDGRLKRCALYRGELLCIDRESAPALRAEEPSAAPDAADVLASAETASDATAGSAPAERCARYQGQTICIKEGS